MNLPFSEACERNKEPILEVLRAAFADRSKVIEIGSGTGQHAVHFARYLPHLVWQPSDREENLPGIRLRVGEAALANLIEPIALDIDNPVWPETAADAVFTANTLHIVSWLRVVRLFERAAALLPSSGVLAAYGPFNYGGAHTSESNARFDSMLRERDPHSGIRDFNQVDELAARQGLELIQDHAMPANNRTAVWRKARGRTVEPRHCLPPQ
jgi:SAM-dependent methyltransferase